MIESAIRVGIINVYRGELVFPNIEHFVCFVLLIMYGPMGIVNMEPYLYKQNHPYS